MAYMSIILPFDIPEVGTIYFVNRKEYFEDLIDTVDVNQDTRLDLLDSTFDEYFSEEELIELSPIKQEDSIFIAGEFCNTFYSSEYGMEDCSWIQVNPCEKIYSTYLNY